MFTRETVLSTLTAAHEKLLARYRVLTSEELEAECTQSEVPDGAPWRAKDHLSHLILIERTFQRIIQRTIDGHPDPLGLKRIGVTNGAELRTWVDHNNQQSIKARYHDDLVTLLTALDAARQDTLALLDRLTDEQLTLPITGAPWADGTIGGLLFACGDHESTHVSWVEKGLQENTPVVP